MIENDGNGPAIDWYHREVEFLVAERGIADHRTILHPAQEIIAIHSDIVGEASAHEAAAAYIAVARGTAGDPRAARAAVARVDPRAASDLPGAPTALVYGSSPRWGSGTTTCFLCSNTIEYNPLGADIPRVQCPDLCDGRCSGRDGHLGDCPALGGDLCSSCLERFKYSSINVQISAQSEAARLRRRAAMLEGYAGANWVEREHAKS